MITNCWLKFFCLKSSESYAFFLATSEGVGLHVINWDRAKYCLMFIMFWQNHFDIPRPVFRTIEKTNKNWPLDPLILVNYENFNFSAPAEYIVSGKYNFHRIIFTTMTNFWITEKKTKKAQIWDTVCQAHPHFFALWIVSKLNFNNILFFGYHYQTF